MRKKLLIVDDNNEFRKMVIAYIESQNLGLQIFEANTGEMGVAKASFVDPDIVLMDINLPNANGLVSAKHIKNDHPNCDLIILTMFNVEAFKHEAKKIDVTDFVGKTEIYERLIPILKDCLDHPGKKVLA